MASALALVRRATALANAGLAGIQELPEQDGAPATPAPAAPAAPIAPAAPVTATTTSASAPYRCRPATIGGLLAGYDELVSAKAILDLLVETPCFHTELGRYAASLELCRGILTRAMRRKRQRIGKTAASQPLPMDDGDPHSTWRSLPPDETIEVGACSGRDRALAGTAPSAATTIATAADGTSIGSIAPASRENADSPSFDSIVGNSAAKRTLFEHVVLPLKLDEDTRNCLFGGIRSSGNNVLLYGPPGTGKTSIVQAASSEAGAAFYPVTPSSILSKYQGESERVLHQLFDDARKTKPSIIFLDELDALAPSRDSQDDVQSRRLLAELLLQTSQLRPCDQVVVVGATNRMDDIDVALLRRFHSRIFVGPPSSKERADMMLSFMDGTEHTLSPEQVANLADRLPGWSGSDIKSLCKEASMGPVRSLYEEKGELERVVAGGGGGRRDEAGEGGSLLNLRPVHVSDLEVAYWSLMGSSSSPPAYSNTGQQPSSVPTTMALGRLNIDHDHNRDDNHDAVADAGDAGGDDGNELVGELVNELQQQHCQQEQRQRQQHQQHEQQQHPQQQQQHPQQQHHQRPQECEMAIQDGEQVREEEEEGQEREQDDEEDVGLDVSSQRGMYCGGGVGVGAGGFDEGEEADGEGVVGVGIGGFDAGCDDCGAIVGFGRAGGGCVGGGGGAGVGGREAAMAGVVVAPSVRD